MTEEKEVWKDIENYEGLYQISNLGKVKSLNYRNTGKEHILKTRLCSGYLYVILYKNCICKNWSIHRLVATTFINNPDNLPCVNHIDENKLNNRVENLEWCSYEYNNNYGTHNERMLKTRKINKGKNAERTVSQFTKDCKFVNEYPSIHEAGRCTGINQGNIWCCCNGRCNTSGGYIWKYKEDVK